MNTGAVRRRRPHAARSESRGDPGPAHLHPGRARAPPPGEIQPRRAVAGRSEHRAVRQWPHACRTRLQVRLLRLRHPPRCPPVRRGPARARRGRLLGPGGAGHPRPARAVRAYRGDLAVGPGFAPPGQAAARALPVGDRLPQQAGHAAPAPTDQAGLLRAQAPAGTAAGGSAAAGTAAGVPAAAGTAAGAPAAAGTAAGFVHHPAVRLFVLLVWGYWRISCAFLLAVGVALAVHALL